MVETWACRTYIWLASRERGDGRDLDARDLDLQILTGMSLRSLLFLVAADNLGFEGLLVLQTGVEEFEGLRRFGNALHRGAWSRQRCQTKLDDSLSQLRDLRLGLVHASCKAVDDFTNVAAEVYMTLNLPQF